MGHLKRTDPNQLINVYIYLMKRILFIPLIVTSWTLSAQSWQGEFGLGYTYMEPLGSMSNNIKRGHGFTADYFITPKNSRFAYGLEFSYTLYGHDKSEQVYTFSDGSTANMDIVVDNSISNLLLAGRYYLRDESILRPFINVKAGYSWYKTDLNIYDPDELDHCEPVDHDLLLKDGTLVLSAGGGFHYDLSAIFKKVSPNRFLFTLNANLALGGRVNYMNTDAPSHHDPSAQDVNARFINTQTQVVHEHHVGYVYSSYAELLDIRAGLIFRKSSRP